MSIGNRSLRAAALLAFLIVGTSVWAQQSEHVLLLDVSGSMEREGVIHFARYSSGQVRDLVAKLGTAIASEDSRAVVIVQPFSSSKEPLPAGSPILPSQLAAAVPNTANGQETELDFALQQQLTRHKNAYVFILTDNKNDYKGNKSDRQFYTLLAKDPGIHTVFLVPLAKPDSSVDALVLYAVALGKADGRSLGRIASQFAALTASEPIAFRGFYTGTSGDALSFGHNLLQTGDDGEDRPVETEGEAVLLRVDEGRPLEGSLKFRIHSKLQHWKIVDGELRKASAKLMLPAEFVGAGEYSIPITISGTHKINVLPGGDTAEIYSLPLGSFADNGVEFRRRNLFHSALPDAPMRVRLQAAVRVSEIAAISGLQPSIQGSLQDKIRAVRNLPEIMHLMTFQPDGNAQNNATERLITFNRDVLIRVRPNPVKTAIGWIILIAGAALLLAVLFLAVMALIPKQYTLLEEGGRSKVISFQLLGGKALLLCGGKPAATLRRSMTGKFRVSPHSGWAAEPVKFVAVPALFNLRNLRTNDSLQYQLLQGASPRGGSAAQEGQI